LGLEKFSTIWLVMCVCGGVQLWQHVLSFVDPECVVRDVSLVSHDFHALATDHHLWRHLVVRAGGGGSVDNLYEGDADGWRRTFFARRWLRSVRHAARVCVCACVRVRAVSMHHITTEEDAVLSTGARGLWQVHAPRCVVHLRVRCRDGVADDDGTSGG
jgi:hypothetical protein